MKKFVLSAMLVSGMLISSNVSALSLNSYSVVDPFDNTVYDERDYKINANGDLVFHGRHQDFYNDGHKVFLYDASSQEAIQLTDADTQGSWTLNSPLNDNGDVVWHGISVANPESGSDIYKYDKASATISNLTASYTGDMRFPSINNSGDVAWKGGYVYFYNNTTQVIQQITTVAVLDNFIQINNAGEVFWKGNSDTSQSGAYYKYDKSTGSTVKLFDFSYNPNTYQPFSVNDSGDVVWLTTVYDENMTYQSHRIYHYDGATQNISLIDDQASGLGIPVINNNGDIAWGVTLSGYVKDVYLRDGQSGVTKKLAEMSDNSTHSWSEGLELNENGDVAWRGIYFNNEGAIYLDTYIYDRAKNSTSIIANGYEKIALSDNGSIAYVASGNGLSVAIPDGQYTLSSTIDSLKLDVEALRYALKDGATNKLIARLDDTLAELAIDNLAGALVEMDDFTVILGKSRNKLSSTAYRDIEGKARNICKILEANSIL